MHRERWEQSNPPDPRRHCSKATSYNINGQKAYEREGRRSIPTNCVSRMAANCPYCCRWHFATFSILAPGRCGSRWACVSGFATPTRLPARHVLGVLARRPAATLGPLGAMLRSVSSRGYSTEKAERLVQKSSAILEGHVPQCGSELLILQTRSVAKAQRLIRQAHCEVDLGRTAGGRGSAVGRTTTPTEPFGPPISSHRRHGMHKSTWPCATIQFSSSPFRISPVSSFFPPWVTPQTPQYLGPPSRP